MQCLLVITVDLLYIYDPFNKAFQKQSIVLLNKYDQTLSQPALTSAHTSKTKNTMLHRNFIGIRIILSLFGRKATKNFKWPYKDKNILEILIARY